MAAVDFTITILDLDEIRAILDEAIDAVPEWEGAQLRERLAVLIRRAHERRRKT